MLTSTYVCSRGTEAVRSTLFTMFIAALVVGEAIHAQDFQEVQTLTNATSTNVSMPHMLIPESSVFEVPATQISISHTSLTETLIAHISIPEISVPCTSITHDVIKETSIPHSSMVQNLTPRLRYPKLQYLRHRYPNFRALASSNFAALERLPR